MAQEVSRMFEEILMTRVKYILRIRSNSKGSSELLMKKLTNAIELTNADIETLTGELYNYEFDQTVDDILSKFKSLFNLLTACTRRYRDSYLHALYNEFRFFQNEIRCTYLV